MEMTMGSDEVKFLFIFEVEQFCLRENKLIN